MSITPEQIDHIARLARLELDSETKKILERDMPEILSFVETLNELDTSKVEPVSGGTMLHSVMRDDAQIDSSLEKKSASLIKAVPEKTGNLIKVKSVF